MVANNLDSILVEAYGEFDVPVDRFMGDEALIHEFVAVVRQRSGNSQIEVSKTMRRLMNLRKKGQLPRLRRSYNGRIVRDIPQKG